MKEIHHDEGVSRSSYPRNNLLSWIVLILFFQSTKLVDRSEHDFLQDSVVQPIPGQKVVFKLRGHFQSFLWCFFDWIARSWTVRR
jgi:hypothetical protein